MSAMEQIVGPSASGAAVPSHNDASSSSCSFGEKEKEEEEVLEPQRTTTRVIVNDPEDVVNLPYRTLSNNANMEEYTTETISGQILKTVKSNVTGKEEKYEVVTFTIDDKENPKNWSKAFKWWCTACVAGTCFAVAFDSAVITADIGGVAREFHCSEEAALLSITLFVCGFGVG